MRASKHFFSLASAEIYRNLDFNFTSADGSSNGAPTSHIAEAIQAIVASDQDYGQHIKSFRLGISEETSQNGLLMNRVLWDSVADPSKVLNTLILLLVKKAQTIETFQYDLFYIVKSAPANCTISIDGILRLNSVALFIKHFTESRVYIIYESGLTFPAR